MVIKVIDYYRVRSKKQIMALIHNLNQRFSENGDQLFYRDFTIPEEKQEKFRKIYAMTYAYFNGFELLKYLLRSDTLKIEKLQMNTAVMSIFQKEKYKELKNLY